MLAGVAAATTLTSCAKGTYVALTVRAGIGAPSTAARIDLQLTLGARTATTALQQAGGVALPTTATLRINSGDGPLTITAIARDDAGVELARGVSSGIVTRDNTTDIVVTLGGSAVAMDLSGLDLTGADLSSPDDLTPPPEPDLLGLDLLGVDLTRPPDMAPATFPVTVTIRNVAGATGTVTGGGLNCPGTCTVQAAGNFTFSISPSAGNEFLTPVGGTTCNASPCTVNVTGATNLTVTFRPRANIAFLSSTKLNMPFGASASASQTAADTHCRTLAAAANLPSSANYVAFLSTTGVTAQSKLGSSRGWVRTDGKPILDALAADNKLLYLPRLDENGADRASTFPSPATGTTAALAISATRCTDWTVTSGTGTVGSAIDGGGKWIERSAVACTGPFHLYCFETGRNVTIANPPITARRAWVSGATFDTSTGIGGADTVCKNEATAAGFPNAATNYVAFLATTSASAISRLNLGGANWQRPDGVFITAATSDLNLQTLYSPLNVTAQGAYVTQTYVMTGQTSAGAVGSAADTCSNWTSLSGSPDGGQAELGWSWNFQYNNSLACTSTANVYCFEK